MPFNSYIVISLHFICCFCLYGGTVLNKNQKTDYPCGCPVVDYQCSCIDFTIFCIGMKTLPRFTSQESCTEIHNIYIDTYYMDRIENVPSDFFKPLSRYWNLKRISIVGDKIRNLGANIFRNMSIGELAIRSEHYKDLRKDIFKDVFKVGSLILEGNDFREIPNYAFESLQGTGTLSLRNAAISHPLIIKSNSFNGGLYSTIHLDLSANAGISIESNAFQIMPSLRFLILEGSLGLRITNKTFTGLHKLTHLDLRKIGLESLEQQIFNGFTYLEELLLEGNQIREILPGTFEPLLNLETLTLTLSQGFNQSLDTFYALQTTIHNIFLQIDSSDVLISDSVNPFQTRSDVVIDLQGATTCPSITSDICSTFRNITFKRVDKACEEIKKICE